MMKLIIIAVIVGMFVVPVGILAWKVYRRLHPAPKPIDDMTPEEFTHLHLDKSMTSIELMAAQRELRDKQEILTNMKERALVQQQIDQIDQQLITLECPPDDGKPLSQSVQQPPRILQ